MGMGKRNPEDDALDQILGDMDGMEGSKMMGPQAGKGVSITISVVPDGQEGESHGGKIEENDFGAKELSGDEFPEGHDEAMCGGGCAMHAGGKVDVLRGNGSLQELPGFDAGGLIEPREPGAKGPNAYFKGGKVPDGSSINEDGHEHSEGEEDGAPQDDAKKLPPFLRKKKKPLQDA